MKTKTVQRGNKQVKMFLKECVKCGITEWRIYNATRMKPQMCQECAAELMTRNNAPYYKGKSKQDEERDREMIDSWLEKYESKIIETKESNKGVTGSKMGGSSEY